MTCLVNGSNDLEPKTKIAKTSSDLEEFDETFNVIVTDLINDSDKDTEDAVEWFKQVLEYNVPFGKKNRGMTVVSTYRILHPKATNDDIQRARILGWCVEMLQAFFLIADDIMDQSITRRGKPCWYKQHGVGNVAINDAFYLECSLYKILKKYFRNHACYMNLHELFHETTFQTVTGQCLDLITAPVDAKVDFTNFTLDKYWAIVKWKTAYYSFYLPVALAMYMAGISDEKVHSDAKTILLEMGKYFQVQDDYLDCYGDPTVIGKIGTDIQDNKCSWLIVQALRQANSEQRTVLQDNYAQTDPMKVASVKAIYNKLDLQEVYRQYEESSYLEIMRLIKDFHGNLPKDIFIEFVRRIYKRNK